MYVWLPTYTGVPVDASYFERNGKLASALSIEKARRLLGWEPQEDWRGGQATMLPPTVVENSGGGGGGGYVPTWHLRRRGSEAKPKL